MADPNRPPGRVTFCTCGHGNTVPWESTAEPETIVVVDDLPPVPTLDPLKFELEPTQGRQLRAASHRCRTAAAAQSPGQGRNLAIRICVSITRIVPNRRTALTATRGSVKIAWSPWRPTQYAAHARIARVKALHLPLPNSQLAVFSLLLAMITGPLAFCLYPMGLSFQTQKLALLALVPQCSAMILGIWALRFPAIVANRADRRWLCPVF